VKIDFNNLISTHVNMMTVDRLLIAKLALRLSASAARPSVKGS